MKLTDHCHHVFFVHFPVALQADFDRREAKLRQDSEAQLAEVQARFDSDIRHATAELTMKYKKEYGMRVACGNNNIIIQQEEMFTDLTFFYIFDSRKFQSSDSIRHVKRNWKLFKNWNVFSVSN